MAAACPLGDPSCPYSDQRQRHAHVSADLNAIGQPCTCGRNHWLIVFGGLLPARVVCSGCREGFNIAQRLRECGRPDTPIYRRNG